jgi:HEAT repeat protein
MSETELKVLLDSIAAELPPELRKDAEQSLEELASAGVMSVAQLKRYLKQPQNDSKSLVAACHVAGRIRDARLTDAVIEAFGRSLDPGVVWEAAKALVALSGTQPPGLLMPWLDSDADAVHQAAAAWTAGALQYREAVRPLMTLLINDRMSETVRAHAAEALGVIGDMEAVDLLISQLSDQSAEVRFWSVYALGTLRATGARDAIRRLADADTGTAEIGVRVADEAKWALGQLDESVD